MSEKIAAAVWVKPRRRIGFGSAVLAGIVLAVVLLAGGFSSASNAAQTTGHAGRSGAQAGRNAGQAGQGASTAQQQQINAKVNSLLGQMTVAEKFGQLEMAGPSTPTAAI